MNETDQKTTAAETATLPDDLEAMNAAELRGLADARGLKTRNKTKGELVAMLIGHSKGGLRSFVHGGTLCDRCHAVVCVTSSSKSARYLTCWKCGHKNKREGTRYS